MTSNQNHPREFDAIRGGDAPPLLGAVLGGVEGVKQRLASSDIETRHIGIDLHMNNKIGQVGRAFLPAPQELDL